MSAEDYELHADLLRTVFQECTSGIAVLNTENRFTLTNKKLLGMTGYDEKDLTGPEAALLNSEKQQQTKAVSFLDIVSPSDQPWVSAQLRKAEEGKEVSVLPCAILGKDGSNIPVLLRCLAMKQAGKTTGLILFIQENKERSGIWVEDNRPIGLNASGPLLDEVAHDFNDLLFLILGNIEYLKEKIGGDRDLKAHIDSALHAGEQVKELIIQLHNFSRQTRTTHRPVRVGSVIKETVDLLNISLLPSIKIKMNIMSDALVMADPALIQQILMNLCANTEYAMQSKSGEIGIKLEEVLLDRNSPPVCKGMKEGDCLKLTVCDNGPGMPPEVIEHLFDHPFPGAEKDRAYCMGFNNVHDIVESHGGQITVKSEVGKGSTFEILLPIHERIQDTKEKTIVRISGGTERILFVDDEKDFTIIGKELLQPLGYRVTTQTNSQEALRLFKENPNQFDLVITDMLMPQLSGDQLAKGIHNLRPKLPIILCTGFSLLNMNEDAAKIGIRAIVRKPVILSELVRTIRQVLDEPAK